MVSLYLEASDHQTPFITASYNPNIRVKPNLILLCALHVCFSSASNRASSLSLQALYVTEHSIARMGILSFYGYSFGFAILVFRFLSLLVTAVRETVFIDKQNNLVLRTTYLIGYHSTTVIPLSSIDYFFLHEYLHRHSYRYYIGAKYRDSTKVKVIFQRIPVPLRLLEPTFHELADTKSAIDQRNSIS